MHSSQFPCRGHSANVTIDLVNPGLSKDSVSTAGAVGMLGQVYDVFDDILKYAKDIGCITVVDPIVSCTEVYSWPAFTVLTACCKCSKRGRIAVAAIICLTYG